MIKNEIEYKACYDALQQLDKIKRQILDVASILMSLGTNDINKALGSIHQRQQNIFCAIGEYIDSESDYSSIQIPDLDSALSSVLRAELASSHLGNEWGYNQNGGSWIVSFTGFGQDKKIATIKELRCARDMGLRETKQMVEGATREAPSRVCGLSMHDAEVLEERLNALGCNASRKCLDPDSYSIGVYHQDGGDYMVILTRFDCDKKFFVIREIQHAKPMRSREVRELVEGASDEKPAEIRGLSYEDAKELSEHLEDLGCVSGFCSE